MTTRRSLITGALLVAAAPARAQLGIFTAPKTLVDRALEARSTIDIAKDNAVVIKVNAVMADAGTVKASTEIYEQRLLVTGLFDDKPSYDKFQQGVRGVSGVKKLYWHVIYMSDVEQKQKKLLSWANTLVIEEKAKARLVGEMDIHDLNYRVSAAPTGTVYLLGRAFTEDEHHKALARTRDGDGVKRVVDYVEVRPK